MNKKHWLLMLMLVCLVGLLSACYGGGSDSSEGEAENDERSEGSDTGDSEGGTLHMATPGELPTVQTNGNLVGLSQTVMLNIYEGLLRMDLYNGMSKSMVEVYEMTENEDWSVTYTNNIRENAIWSDGTQLTSHDFVDGWKRVLDPETCPAHAYLITPITNAN